MTRPITLLWKPYDFLLLTNSDKGTTYEEQGGSLIHPDKAKRSEAEARPSTGGKRRTKVGSAQSFFSGRIARLGSSLFFPLQGWKKKWTTRKRTFSRFSLSSESSLCFLSVEWTKGATKEWESELPVELDEYDWFRNQILNEEAKPRSEPLLFPSEA